MITYFSPVRWNSITQRPHRFWDWLQRLARPIEEQVVWVDPYPTRLLRLSDLQRLGRRLSHEGTKPPWAERSILPPNHLIRPVALPLEPIALLRPLVDASLSTTLLQLRRPNPRIVVIAKPSQLALSLLRTAPSGTPVLFDLMDDLPAFLSGRSASWMELLIKRTLDQSQLIWTSSERLFQMVSSQVTPGKPVELIRNGADIRQSLESRSCWRARPRPALAGYIGTIASWLDWSTLIQCASSYREVEFRLYGPVEGDIPPSKTLPSNLRLMGAVSTDQVPAVLAELDLGLIPFVLNRLTDSVDPVKYYEYRAAGLGIVSTRFGDMRLRDESDGVYFFSQPNAIELAHLETVQRRTGTGDFGSALQAMDWDSRFSSSRFKDWVMGLT